MCAQLRARTSNTLARCGPLKYSITHAPVERATAGECCLYSDGPAVLGAKLWTRFLGIRSIDPLPGPVALLALSDEQIGRHERGCNARVGSACRQDQEDDTARDAATRAAGPGPGTGLIDSETPRAMLVTDAIVQLLFGAVHGAHRPGCFGGILSDDTGLGKTIQTVALVGTLVKHLLASRILIIVPVTLLPVWAEQFSTHMAEGARPFCSRGRRRRCAEYGRARAARATSAHGRCPAHLVVLKDPRSALSHCVLALCS